MELAPVCEPSGVAEEVVRTLGLVARLGSEEDPVDQLREWLVARRLLLMLDNCEHVVDEVAALLEAVLPAAPGLSVLATSREVLALPGEVSWSVPPLSLPPAKASRAADLTGSDAVELFCHRARSAQPAFALSDANAAAVAQICGRLDGIPLALELAASRIRVLGAHQLAERLKDRYRVLAGTSRGAPRRHQTLQATMDWSWDLLPGREREALRRLSVFPASFDLDAAEAVVSGTAPAAGDDGPADSADLIIRLVDKSLVAAGADGSDGRYRLLETVRTYAATRLAEAGEEEAARRAHCDHFLEHARRVESTGYWARVQWVLDVAADQASFRAAIGWCLDGGRRDDAVRLMATYWLAFYLSNQSGGEGLLHRCLAEPRPAPSPALVECLGAVTFLVPEGGEAGLSLAEAAVGEAVQMARELGDEAVVNRARIYQGFVLMNQGRFDEGRAVMLAARDYYAERGMPLASAWFDHGLGWERMARADHAGARSTFEQGLEGIGADRGDNPDVDPLIAVSLAASVAAVAAAGADADAARRCAAHAVEMARGVPLGGFLTLALARATQAALLIGDDGWATESLTELLATLRELGGRTWVSGALAAAISLLPAGDAEDAAVEARLLGAADGIRAKLEEGSDPVLADRLNGRRAEIAALLSPERLADETERGRRASADEALRWALAALQGRRDPTASCPAAASAG